jgi:hypothetical protein
MATDLIADELLLRGLDDWVDASEVAFVVARQLSLPAPAADPREVLDVALAVLRTLLDEGFVEIGEVTDGGFFAWETSTDDSIARVHGAWDATLPNGPGLGEVFWIANTGKGDARAQRRPQGRERLESDE